MFIIRAKDVVTKSVWTDFFKGRYDDMDDGVIMIDGCDDVIRT